MGKFLTQSSPLNPDLTYAIGDEIVDTTNKIYHTCIAINPNKFSSIPYTDHIDNTIDIAKDITNIASDNCEFGSEELVFYLMKNGKVGVAGYRYNSVENVYNWTDIEQIYACYRSCIGVRFDGSCVYEGFENYGREDIVNSWTNVKKIGTSSNVTVAVTHTGQVLFAGKHDTYALNECTKWTDIVDIDCSNDRVVGIRSDGSGIAVGNQSGYYMIDYVNSLKNIKKIYAFNSGLVVAIRDDDTLQARGHIYSQTNNNYKNWTNVKKVMHCPSDATYNGHNFMALTHDGVVKFPDGQTGYCLGQMYTRHPGLMDNLDEFCMTYNRHIVVGITKDKRLVTDRTATVYGAHDQLDDQHHWNNIIDIVPSNNCTWYVRDNNTVTARGQDVSGEMEQIHEWRWANTKITHIQGQHQNYGGSFIIIRSEPANPAHPHPWSYRGTNTSGRFDKLATWQYSDQIAIGQSHAAALMGPDSGVNGTVETSGLDNYNQRQTGTWSNITYVACGSNHTVGIRTDGKLEACGYNNRGQIDIVTNPDWYDITRIWCIDEMTIGERADGQYLLAGGSLISSQCRTAITTSVDVREFFSVVHATTYQGRGIGILYNDGTVYVGGDDSGLGIIKTDSLGDEWKDPNNKVIKIHSYAVGSICLVGLREDGSIIATGNSTAIAQGSVSFTQFAMENFRLAP